MINTLSVFSFLFNMKNKRDEQPGKKNNFTQNWVSKWMTIYTFFFASTCFKKKAKRKKKEYVFPGNALLLKLFTCNAQSKTLTLLLQRELCGIFPESTFIAYFRHFDLILIFKWISRWMAYDEGIRRQIKLLVVCTTCDGSITTKWNHCWSWQKYEWKSQLRDQPNKRFCWLHTNAEINYLFFYDTVMFNIHKSHFIRLEHFICRMSHTLFVVWL